MDILSYSAVELGKAIKCGEVTAVEAMQAVLDQIDKTEETIHAYVTIDKEAALKKAAEVQKKIEAGEIWYGGIITYYREDKMILHTKFEGEYYFVCGTDFNSRANYDIYELGDFSVRHKLQCDYDDGGFRGWGTVFRYPFGSRKKYYWVTFDRHNASGYNWSYGNIYVYEVDVK